jgi:uncharacterized membrane protein YidH (DUF202 family)
MILLNIIGIFLILGALRWVQGLSQCDCSKDNRKIVLENYYYLAILLNIVAIVYRKYWLLTLMFLLTTVAAAVTLSYIVDKRKNRCDCMGKKEKLFFLIAIGQVIVTGTIILAKFYKTYV